MGREVEKRKVGETDIVETWRTTIYKKAKVPMTRGSDCSVHEAQAAAYGRGREAATGGSHIAALTGVATAKRSKAESATASVSEPGRPKK